MDRADLVYRLVEDLEPLLERYASSGIEIAVLISKVNDNVVGYQGTQLGKEFLEKNTHYTESFRKFCRDYWYGSDNVISNTSQKSSDEAQEISFLSATETGAVLNGITDSITVLDGSKISLSNILGEEDDTFTQSSPKICIKTTSDSQTEYGEKKKIRRKARYRCNICDEAFFRREHRLNIHMHEFHSMELSDSDLAAYPLPENYHKKVTVKNNEDAENENGDISINEEKFLKEKKKFVFKYHCNECNTDFKKMKTFNEHRIRYHQLTPVPDDYGKNGYQCGYCPKIFSSRWNLERHIAIHLGHRKFKCSECDQSFFRREELKKHEIRHKCPLVRKSHGKILCFSCGHPMRVKAGENCSIPWSHGDSSMQVKPVFICKTCGKGLEDEDQYNTHILEHHKDVMVEHDYNSLKSNIDSNTNEKEQETADEQINLKANKENMEENEPKDQSGDDIEKFVKLENQKKQKAKKGKANDQKLKETEKIEKDTTNDQKLKEIEKDTANDQKSKELGESTQEPNIMDEGTSSPPKIVKLHYNHENLSSEKKPYTQKNYEGAFQCKICDKSFVTNFVLKRHVLLHGERQKVECEECGTTYSRKDLLARHIKRSHSKNLSNTTVIKCNFCTQKFKDPISLKYHKAKMHKTSWTRTSKPTKKTEIVVKKSFKNGMRSSTSENKRKRLSSCVGCDEGCQSEISPSKSKSPKLDMKAAEVDTATEKQNDHTAKKKVFRNIEGFVYSVSDISNENYTCKKCKKGFRYQNEFVSHKLIHTSKKKVFPCVMCPLVFQTIANLIKHQHKHDKNGNFSCSNCTFATDSLEHLNRHKGSHKEKKSTIENDIKQVMCDQCGKEYANAHRLKEHMLTHSGEKPHKCSVCEKTFHTLDILKNHERTHLDEKPYMCEDCGKTFHQASTLSTHRLVHFESKINCKVCSAKFSRQHGLRAHMVSQHSGSEETKSMNVQILKCDFSSCEKTFLTKKEMDRHKRTHTGERPFKCKHCGKAFRDRSNCLSHEKIHLIKKQKCKYCAKDYVHKQDLKRHVKKLHPDVVVIDENDTELAVLGKEGEEAGEIDVVGEQGEVEKNQTQGKGSPKKGSLANKKSSRLNNAEKTGSDLIKDKIVDLENEAGITDKQAAALNLQKSYDNSINNTAQDSNEETSSEKAIEEIDSLPVPIELVQNSATLVENTEDQMGTSNITQEIETAVQNVMLHTSDEENGPSTIYVVQTISSDAEEGGEPKIIYYVNAPE